MTAIPKPADPAGSFTATYDAWNRLVRVEQEVVGPVTVKIAEYAYDGLMRRTEKSTFTAGVLATTRHFYYTSSWQAIEERLDTSTSPDRQFVWGPLYIDHLILRDRDTSVPPNGTLDERLYPLQDANWNVTALADTNGDAQERYLYDAYGTPTVLTGTFGSRTGSSYDWDRLFAGYCWDSHISLYHIRYRCYSAHVAWLQRDPAGFVDGNNLYQYVNGRAPNKTDARGLQGSGFRRAASWAFPGFPDATDLLTEVPCKNFRKWDKGLCTTGDNIVPCKTCTCAETQYGEKIQVAHCKELLTAAKATIAAIGGDRVILGNFYCATKCGGTEYGLTCWRTIPRGPNRGKLELGVCIPYRTRSVCEVIALIKHELTHVRELARLINNADEAVTVDEIIATVDVTAFERSAYNVQCQEYADQRCLLNEPARGEWIRQCVSRLIGLSTGHTGRRDIASGCDRFAW